MSKDDYFVIACKVLCYLYDCLKSGKPVDVNFLSNKNKTFAVNDSYWDYIISTMAEEGYIKNVRICEMDDSLLVSYDKDIKITPAGIEYLHENSMMKKALKVLEKISNLGFSIKIS
jgi:hypothetical protein